MLDIETYRSLSDAGKAQYEKYEQYYDGMAEKWQEYVDMTQVIELDAKEHRVREAKYPETNINPN